MCCQGTSRQCTDRPPEREGEKGKVTDQTPEKIPEGSSSGTGGATARSLDLPVCSTRMGCTTGHLACQSQPPATSGQEGQSLEAGGAKVPEVLSSLERLSQATGGMEKSWYRCIFPFGIISLVIGVAGTGVTYTYNDLPQTKVVSVVLLIVGLVLVLTASVCWTVHKKKKRKKKEGGSFTSEQCPL
ncbi:transmembrane protein 100 [Lampris incognitus]|uniref:transmembrane protein 100 n=1 Tax=Lampris incognitus TaxID=2546036 RepID=UPI0024B5A58F|nr:transmembrane protein 100 [Lampris incognitus]